MTFLQRVGVCAILLVGGWSLAGGPLDGRKGELLYECSMADADSIAAWKMEGPGETEHKDGWMHMYCKEEAMHHVFWCPQAFPESFVAEWDAWNQETDAGLCVMFFASTGANGESIFDESLSGRSGKFSQYVKGDIKNYHLCYYANSRQEPDLGECRLYKNPGYRRVWKTRAAIPTDSREVHRVTLMKDDDRIVVYVGDRRVIDWEDWGTTHGPVLGAGHIGFRQMRSTHFAYRNFRVWATKEGEEMVPPRKSSRKPRGDGDGNDRRRDRDEDKPPKRDDDRDDKEEDQRDDNGNGDNAGDGDGWW